MRNDNLYDLPDGLPAPLDDGAAEHLAGRKLPALGLTAMNGAVVDLSAVKGRVVGHDPGSKLS